MQITGRRRAANLHKSSSWGVVGTTPRGPNGRRARAERPSADMKATDAFRRVHAFSPSSRPFAEFAPSPSSPLPPSSRPFAELTPFRRVRPFRRDHAFRRVHPLRRVHPFPPSSPPCRFCRGPPPRDLHPPSGVVRQHPTRRSSSPRGERACCRLQAACCRITLATRSASVAGLRVFFPPSSSREDFPGAE